MTHDSAPALHTCLPIYHARVLLMVNDTRLSLSTLIIHVYIARPARGAKHLLTTTRTTHDRSTRGNFGLAVHLAPDMVKRGWGRIISVTTSVGSMLRAGMGLFHHQRAAVHIFSADISDQRSQPLQGVRVCRE